MKLFCFDIDGTLMPFGDYEIPQEEKEALQALLDNGHAIALASGRPFVSLQHHLLAFNGKRKYYICANGAAVYNHHGEVIKETSLTSEDLLYLQRYAKEDVNVYAYEGRGGIVSYKIDRWIEDEMDYNLIQRKDIVLLKKGEPIVGHNQLLKIMLAGPEETMKDLNFSEEDKAKYEWNWSAPTYLELLQKGSTKGQRVEDLRQHLGVAIEDVYCFGDEGNDISMVSRFNGIAMGNAIQPLKDVAKYVTLSAKEHGVVHALKNILKVI